jgi:hypothetical protein
VRRPRRDKRLQHRTADDPGGHRRRVDELELELDRLELDRLELDRLELDELELVDRHERQLE